jgi:methyl-accepting chemotaxis protein
VYKSANYANEDTVPSIKIINKAAISYGLYRARVYRFVMNSNADDATKNSIQSKIDEAQKDLLSAFNAYEKVISNPEDQLLLKSDRDTFLNYQQKAQPILDFARSNSNLAEASKMINSVANLSVQVDEQFEKHIAFNEKLGLEASLDAEKSNSDARTYLFSFFGIIALALVIISLKIKQQIVTQITRAQDITKLVSKGDLRDSSV